MIQRGFTLAVSLCALTGLSACDEGFEFDMRGKMGGLDTSGAAASAVADKPQTDARGVISYPNYQVAVAQPGDTVVTLAERVRTDAQELASYNGLKPSDTLRPGEVLALPRRVAVPRRVSELDEVDITAVASGAIDNAGGTQKPSAVRAPLKGVPEGPEPVRHKVERGETAYSIARLYKVSVRSLADWNGLGPDLIVREGQYLLIPVVEAQSQSPRNVRVVTVPGVGTDTPTPPSASAPLPEEDRTVTQATLPPSPNLGKTQTAASLGKGKFVTPVDGPIIRPYTKGRNDGIDISAAAGTAVRAAAAGEVAAITRDTDQVPILVLRHEGGLLTVYANLDKIAVKKGDKVKRGQKLAVVRASDPAFLHFEVRKGFESVDPEPYLN